MKLKKFIARVYDLPNAYRVLDIMDTAGGVDIVPAVNMAGQEFEGYFDIKTKYWLSEQDAKDLQTITLHKHQYKQRDGFGSRIFWRIFRNYRKGCRVLKDWP